MFSGLIYFAAANDCDNGFFLLPHWWKYLNPPPDPSNGCSLPDFNFPDDIAPVGLALIDILLRVAGLVAIVSIIIAGVMYITAGGDMQRTAQARKRIWNALIGLSIVFLASGIVAFIGSKLGG
jgi:hypothetical protein